MTHPLSTRWLGLLGWLMLAPLAPISTASAQATFIRGDANMSGALDLSDIYQIINMMGGRHNLLCEDAADFNDDGLTDLSDVVATAGFMFQGHRPPTSPYPAAGTDPTADDLGCSTSVRSRALRTRRSWARTRRRIPTSSTRSKAGCPRSPSARSSRSRCPRRCAQRCTSRSPRTISAPTWTVRSRPG